MQHGQQPLRFAGMAAPVEFAVPLHKKLEECVANGTIKGVLEAAIAYCTKIFLDEGAGWFNPKAACKSQPVTQHSFQTRVKDQMALPGATFADLEILHGGSLAQLDLADRAAGLDHLDLRKMRGFVGKWVLPSQFSKEAPTFQVQGATVHDGPKRHLYSCDIRRIEGDWAVDVALLAVYWSKDDEEVQKVLKQQLNNCVFCAQWRGDTAVELEVERFERYVKEDAQKNSLGRTAFLQASDCLKLLSLVPQSEREGKKDGDVLAEQLGKKKSLAKSWKPDTCDRCLHHTHTHTSCSKSTCSGQRIWNF